MAEQQFIRNVQTGKTWQPGSLFSERTKKLTASCGSNLAKTIWYSHSISWWAAAGDLGFGIFTGASSAMNIREQKSGISMSYNATGASTEIKIQNTFQWKASCDIGTMVFPFFFVAYYGILTLDDALCLLGSVINDLADETKHSYDYETITQEVAAFGTSDMIIHGVKDFMHAVVPNIANAEFLVENCKAGV